MQCVSGNLPPATAKDAEGVHRASRVRPEAPLHRLDQEGHAHRRHHVPRVPRAEIRRDCILRRREQFAGTYVRAVSTMYQTEYH